MFKNVKIGKRLLFSYVVIIIVTIAISVVGMINFNSMAKSAERNFEIVTKPISYLTNFSIPYGNLRSAMRDLYWSTSDETNQKQKEALEKNWALMETQIAQYIALLEENEGIVSSEEYESVKKVEAALVNYKDALFNRLVPAGMANENEEAYNIRDAELVGPGNVIRDEINYLTETKIEEGAVVLAEITDVRNMTMVYSILLVVFALVVVVFLATKITNSIVKPINHMILASEALVKGDLNVNTMNDAKDEIGILSRYFGEVIQIIRQLTHGIDKMAREYRAGDMDTRIDGATFTGSYQMVVDGVNDMVGDIVNELQLFAGCMSSFGEGDFSADIPAMPGKKAIMNHTVNAIRENLRSVNQDIGILVQNAIDGNLSNRVNAVTYKGDWHAIMNQLNRLMEAIADPIREASEVLRQVSAGNFDHQITGNYSGDFLTIKKSVNDTVTNVAVYIEEISDILNSMSRNDLSQEITREYVGAFSHIKDALNDIIEKFNLIISDIRVAAEQVTAGSKQVSESSVMLAQGASEQAASVEELNATLITINETTAYNAENAKQAEDLSTTSKNNAQKGNQDVENMLSSMDGINDASKNIAKIIKVIDDIAFQTNLLALNAAVEAARAGEHGKGFAVVAEEVRSLAARSQTAARETAEYIEESISRVNEGTRMAGETANALQTIVGDVTQVASIISEIALSSQEQASAIGQVTEGLSQITDVVQNNSATSEEAASASEELSSQAEVLKDRVDIFKLK